MTLVNGWGKRYWLMVSEEVLIEIWVGDMVWSCVLIAIVVDLTNIANRAQPAQLIHLHLAATCLSSNLPGRASCVDQRLWAKSLETREMYLFRKQDLTEHVLDRGEVRLSKTKCSSQIF